MLSNYWEALPIYSITHSDHLITPVDCKSVQAMVTAILDDRKASDIVSINIKEKSDFADMMLVASGTSSRHVASMAGHVIHGLKSVGLEPKVEGLEGGEWVLIDVGDVVIHLFQPETRDYYKIEKMWGVPHLTQAMAQEPLDA